MEFTLKELQVLIRALENTYINTFDGTEPAEEMLIASILHERLKDDYQDEYFEQENKWIK